MTADRQPSKCDEYRDLLETWAAWWNNVGRRHFTHYITPPITATGEALACLACQGITDDEGDRCEVCGRRITSSLVRVGGQA